MRSDQFDPQKVTLSDLRIQLEVTKERLGYREEELIQKKLELDRVRSEQNRQESELRQAITELNELKTKFEVTKERLGHKEETLSIKTTKANKKSSNAKLQAVFVSLLFLIANFLSGFAINMLTSTPPDTKGNILMVFACITYIVATCMTIFVIGESNS